MTQPGVLFSVRLGEAVEEARRWQEDLAARARYFETRALACGWQVHMLPSGSGVSVFQRPVRRYAEPLTLDGDAFDTDSLAYMLPIRSVSFPTKRYATTHTLWAHPLDAVLFEANARDDLCSAVRWGRAPDIGGLRAFWKRHREPPAKRRPIGALRRFWRQNAAVRVTLAFRSPGVALDHEERTVYVDGPGPWWLALEAERLDLSQDLATEWVALRVRVRSREDADRADRLWGRMSPEQRAQAQDRLLAGRMWAP